MRVLATEISTDHWQWILDSKRVGILGLGGCESVYDVRQAALEAIFQGWGGWSDDERGEVMDMLVRNHFEYWDKNGNSVTM